MGKAISPQSHHEESEIEWPLKYLSRQQTQEEICRLQIIRFFQRLLPKKACLHLLRKSQAATATEESPFVTEAAVTAESIVSLILSVRNLTFPVKSQHSSTTRTAALSSHLLSTKTAKRATSSLLTA